MVGFCQMRKLCLFFVFLSFLSKGVATTDVTLPQKEQGWRWKKTFTLSFQGKTYGETDAVHEGLARECQQIRKLLVEFRVQSLGVALEPDNPDSSKNWEIFAQLNSGGETIGENLKGIEKEFLPGWKAATGETGWTEFKKRFSKVFDILEENLKRIQTRNIAIARIGYLDEKSRYQTLPVTDPKAPTTLAVFLSGTGNELVRIMEKFTSFATYRFLIFDENYKGFLRGNLGFILKQKVPMGMPPLPEAITKKSDSYAGIVDRYCASYKNLEKQIAEYGAKLISFRGEGSKLQALAGPEISAVGILSSHQAVFIGARELSDIAHTIPEKSLDVQNLVGDFYHSEQLMRLFLYGNLKSLLPSQVLERRGLIVLHVHSLNDLCDRCAHCLFLESAMSHVCKSERAEVGSKKSSRKDPYGFFEKLNNPEQAQFSREDFVRSDRFYPLILVSSEVAWEKSRYMSGHDGSTGEAIIVEKFFPLMAFKTIPSFGRLQLLPQYWEVPH